MPMPDGIQFLKKRGYQSEFVGVDDSITDEITWILILDKTNVIHFYIEEIDRVVRKMTLAEFIKMLPKEFIKEMLKLLKKE